MTKKRPEKINPNAATITHILCDHEERLDALEKKMGVELPSFWMRRIISSIQNGENASLIAACLKNAIEHRGKK